MVPARFPGGVIALAAGFVCGGAAAAPERLVDLSTLDISDDFFSEGASVSGDGRIIGGRGTPSVRAWVLHTTDLQSQFIPVVSPSNVNDLSFDGSVAVGNFDADRSYWISTVAGFRELGDLDPNQDGSSVANGVSADGLRVAGSAISPGGVLSFLEAYLYTVTDPATGAGTMIGLGDLPGGDQYSEGAAISSDGRTVVGGSSSAASQAGGAPFLDFEAFRWREATGVMEALGDLPGGSYYSFATGVSADGNVVVGGSSSAASGISDLEAFIWTPSSGMVGLGDLPGGNFVSVALDVSADGRVVVGYSAVAIGDGGLDEFAPFIWDATNGMRNLVDVFAAAGLTTPNLRLTHATAISDDGTTITGYGKGALNPSLDERTEAWLATFSAPPVSVPALTGWQQAAFALVLLVGAVAAGALPQVRHRAP